MKSDLTVELHWMLESNSSNNTMFFSEPSSSIVVAMFVCGVLGNILALFVLFKTSKHHKWKTFNRLVGALAIFDLFGILATTPIVILNYKNNFSWVGGQVTCDYFSCIMILAGLTTIFMIAFMSLERFLAVCCPYFYKNQITKQKVNITVLLLFGLALVIALLPIVGFGQNVEYFPGSWCFFDFYGTSDLQRVYSVMYSCIGIILISTTAVFNIILIVTLGKEVRKKLQNRKCSITSQSSRRRKRNDIYLMVFLTAILMVFGICYTPLMIRVILTQAGVEKHCSSCDLLAIRLASLNQILDPWVYILLRKENIVRIVKCAGSLKSALQHSLSFTCTYCRSTVKESTDMTLNTSNKTVCAEVSKNMEKYENSQDTQSLM